MKKFYLTVGQRKAIINALYAEKNTLQSRLIDQKPSQAITETVEAAQQELVMLADLFKVDDDEQD